MLWGIRLRQLWSRIKRAERTDQIRNLLLIIIFSAFTVSLTYLGNQLFTEFLKIPLLGRYVMLQTLSLLFLSFFIMLLFSAMVTGLATGYMSRDLDSLFSSPVPGPVIFWSRLSEATFHSAWMVLIFGYPVLVSYGWVTGSPWYYFPVAFLVMIPFVLIPSTLGFFLIVAILYWIPIKRIRTVLVTIAIIFGGLMIYVLRLFSPRILIQPEVARELFLQFLSSFEIAHLPGLPSFHAAYFLHGLSQSGGGGAWYHLLWLLGLTALTLVICGWLGQRWYSLGWLQTREGRPHQRTGNSTGWIKKLFSFLPRPYNSLCQKEALLFVRETTQWAQLLVLLGIIIVHLANLYELTGINPFFSYLLYYGNMILIGFIITAVCVRFVFPTLSFEGRSFWILRTAPLSMFQLFLQKILFYLLPLTLLGSGLILITNLMLPISSQMLILSIIFIGSLTVLLTAGALAFGSLFPRFEYEHFAEVVTGAGSVLYMLCGMFYVALITGVSALPLLHGFTSSNPEEWSDIVEVSGFVPTIVALSLFSLGLAGFLLWISARAMNNYDFTQA